MSSYFQIAKPEKAITLIFMYTLQFTTSRCSIIYIDCIYEICFDWFLFCTVLICPETVLSVCIYHHPFVLTSTCGVMQILFGIFETASNLPSGSDVRYFKQCFHFVLLPWPAAQNHAKFSVGTTNIPCTQARKCQQRYHTTSLSHFSFRLCSYEQD